MWEHTFNKELKLCFCSKCLCSFYSVLIIKLRWLIRQVSLYSSIKTQQGASERRKQQVTICLTLSWCKPFSGLHGSDLLWPRGVCPRRVPLLCRMGRARMRESPGLLHGPVLRTWSFPGRHGNLQLWSQLDRPRLLYRWERSKESQNCRVLTERAPGTQLNTENTINWISSYLFLQSLI